MAFRDQVFLPHCKSRNGRKDLVIIGAAKGLLPEFLFWILVEGYKNHARKKGAVLIDRLLLWKCRNRGQPYSSMPGADLLFVNPDYLDGGQVAWGQFKMQYSKEILGGLREAQTKGTFRRKITALRRRPPANLFNGIADGLFETLEMILSHLSSGEWTEAVRFSKETLDQFKTGSAGGGFTREYNEYLKIRNQIQAAVQALNQSQVFTAEQLAFADALAEIG
jgi:hypothetical protein